MNDPYFSYRKLSVYQYARNYVKVLYVLLKKFPVEEKYALCDQIRRAAVSITSNIAEGMGRLSEKEKIHFLEISFGSLYETMSQIEVALDLNYITQEDFDIIESQVNDIARMLSGLRKSYLTKAE